MRTFLTLAFLWLASALVSIPVTAQQVGSGCTPIGRGSSATGFFSDCAVASGTANAIILTPTFGSALTTAQLTQYTRYYFKATATNTAAATARIGASGAGPYSIYRNSAAGAAVLIGGEIINNNWYELGFDSTLNAGAGGWILRTYVTPAASWASSLYDISLVGVLNITDPRGVGSIVTATRTSDNQPMVSPLAITNVCLNVHDNVSTAVSSWCHYWQSVKAGTAAIGGSMFTVEASFQNHGVVATADPYTVNPADLTEIFRLGVGIGSGMTNNVSTPIHIINNGGAFRHGIIFDQTSLDTATGRIAPALAMAQNHSIDWYSGAGNRAWSIYSQATAGNQTLKLLNGEARISSPFVIESTTNATVANTGAFQVAGGFYSGGQGVFSGNLKFLGFSSGSATITQQTAQGTPTLVIPTASGTFAVAAISPITINATTGTVGCATCAVNGSSIILPGYPVGSLPAAVQGDIAFVTDQLTTCPAKGVAPTGGGSVRCVVFYNNVAWVGI